MTAHPTLLDAAVHQCRKNHIYRIVDKDGWLERKLLMSKKFVLDDATSAFLGDLEMNAAKIVDSGKQSPEWLVQSARAPFPLTWIEFSARANTRRVLELGGGTNATPPEMQPPRVGFLIERHQTSEACRATLFSMDRRGNEGMFFSDALAWNPVDDAKPWSPLTLTNGLDGSFTHASSVVFGVVPDPVDSVWFTPVPLSRREKLRETAFENQSQGDALINLWGKAGCVLFLTLAMLTDVPQERVAVPARSRLQRGTGGRSSAAHTVIHLRVPGHRVASEAKRIVGAARRAWHEVRSHWRTYDRGETGCQHAWQSSAIDANKRTCACGAWQRWVTFPSGRGDRSMTRATQPTHYSVEGPAIEGI